MHDYIYQHCPFIIVRLISNAKTPSQLQQYQRSKKKVSLFVQKNLSNIIKAMNVIGCRDEMKEMNA